MTPDDVAFIKAAVIAVIAAATSFGFYGLRLRNRAAERRMLAESGNRLAEADRMALEARIAELEERLDFTERMVAQQQDRKPLHRPTATPV